MNPRMPWDTYFANIALAVSLRGDCARMQVGAILVDPWKRIVGAGYNGSPSGEPGCLSDGACPRASSDVPPLSPYDTCIAVHAEVNAIVHRTMLEVEDSTLYVTYQPCNGCFKVIRQAGVSRIVYPGGEWTRDMGPTLTP